MKKEIFDSLSADGMKVGSGKGIAAEIEPSGPASSVLLKRIFIQREIQELELREKYSSEILSLSWRILEAVFLLVLLSGLANLMRRSFLSEKILIALMTCGTATSSFGLLAIVLRYLFPKK